MRIKILGDNNCARATRHLLRLAGFSVTEFLPVDAVTHAPHFGYAITIELAPAVHTPDTRLKPGFATHAQPAERHGEARSPVTSLKSTLVDGFASSRLFAEDVCDGGRGESDLDSLHGMVQSGQAEACAAGLRGTDFSLCGLDCPGPPSEVASRGDGSNSAAREEVKSTQDESCATGAAVQIPASHIHFASGIEFAAHIHFDSVDSLLEAAVLRHVTQLAADAVILDRPGGVVHSERELRIVIPCTGDARADEAAAVAVEFGVLRGLLDITSSAAKPVLFSAANRATSSGPSSTTTTRSSSASFTGTAGRFSSTNDSSEAAASDPDDAAACSSDDFVAKSVARKKKWWPFGAAVVAIAILVSGAASLWGSSAKHALPIADAAGLSRTGFILSGLDSAPATAISAATRRHLIGAPLAASEGHVRKGRQDESCPTGGAGCTVAMTRPRLVAVSAGRIRAASLAAFAARVPMSTPAQGQFATGSAIVVDPCKGQTKLYASINQTANTQLVVGTASKKIYVCSIHVVVAAATNVALVEGTGSVCATGTAGVSGFGGATAATGWNFAGNGGIAFGNGDSSLGAEGTSADNLCVFNSGSGQVSGGISYVVQ